MKKLNQKGFAALEIILVVLLLAVISGAGYYVYTSRHDSKTSSPAPAKQSQKMLTYTSKEHHSSFTYPENWKIAKQIERPDGSGAGTEVFLITSPSGKVSVRWTGGISGIGGACNPIEDRNDPQFVPDLSLCPKYVVNSSVKIKNADLYE